MFAGSDSGRTSADDQGGEGTPSREGFDTHPKLLLCSATVHTHADDLMGPAWAIASDKRHTKVRLGFEALAARLRFGPDVIGRDFEIFRELGQRPSGTETFEPVEAGIACDR